MTIVRSCALAILVAGVSVADSVAADARSDRQALDQRIARLIADLGSTQFASREKAAAELSQMGLDAFDALHDAQESQDVEIAERAKYLLTSMKIVWSKPSDSQEVKRVLKDYSTQHMDEKDRGARISRLSRLDGTEGLEPLCRLVRYEMSTILAKEAAVAIITHKQFAEPEHREAVLRAIRDEIGTSKREPSKWVLAYGKTLEDPAAQVEGWKTRIAGERKLLVEAIESNSAAPTTIKIVRDLYRWEAELLQQLDKQEEAIDCIRQLIALSDGKQTNQVLEIVDWLIERKAWSVVDEVEQKFPEAFQKDALLLYRLAESQVERGDKTQGEKTAEAALALEPMNYQQHLLVAYQLQERGRFPWAEREYRNVIKAVEMVSLDGLGARMNLSEMLHDQGREAEAAGALSDLVTAIESDQTVRDNLDSLNTRRSSGEFISRMYFFAALDHLNNGRVDKAKAAMAKGADANEEDADLLIAMYRLPGADDEWKKRTDDLINRSATEFKNMVEQMQRFIDDSDNEPNAERAKLLQAMYCNQYAWLIGNTRGDFDEAVRLSHRSLELKPETSGYMDTLAHCYAAKKDFANAVKWQSKAVKLDPHSGQIVRALERFKKGLAEQKD
jgi:tetratricopeptide (TPR) repeat protein